MFFEERVVTQKVDLIFLSHGFAHVFQASHSLGLSDLRNTHAGALLNHETTNSKTKHLGKHHLRPHHTLNTNRQRLGLRLNIVLGQLGLKRYCS